MATEKTGTTKVPNGKKPPGRNAWEESPIQAERRGYGTCKVWVDRWAIDPTTGKRVRLILHKLPGKGKIPLKVIQDAVRKVAACRAWRNGSRGWQPGVTHGRLAQPDTGLRHERVVNRPFDPRLPLCLEALLPFATSSTGWFLGLLRVEADDLGAWSRENRSWPICGSRRHP